ncbi:transposase, partial [Gluconobacter kondonii]|uniref:transposase n=1 Tax=Gluconobacter kondonii TaxID=941463 RepID=UPI003570A901
MRIALDSLPFDPITLQTMVRDLAGAVDEGQTEIDRLRQIIREFQRARFGRRAETLEPDQLLLTLEADIPKTPVIAPTSTLITEISGAAPIVKSPHRKALPEHLPRTDVTILPDVTACLSCGGALRDAGT